jgi:hypothetical protein
MGANPRKGIKNLSKIQREEILVPKGINEVLVGILLGDAHIEKRSSTSNARLKYAQTAVAHKTYFNHVFNIFKPFCTDGFSPKSKLNVDKRTNKSFSSISFTTMQLPCFNWYREIFYTLNVKKVPDNIYELLTPKGLAFWIMDDGSKHGSGLHLSVYGFSNTDVDKLMFTLQDKFKFRCSIHYNNRNKPRIYIFKESMGNLITITKPFFVKEMLYKLGL